MMGRSVSVKPGGASRGRRGWELAVMSAVLIAGAARAQTAPAPAPSGDFPVSNAEADILHWVVTRTSIARSSILMIEPRAVVALAGRSPVGATGDLAHAEVREELIGPDAKTRSASFSVDLDCAGRRFRIIQRKTYALPDLHGEAQDNPQPAPWAEVNEGAPVAKAWKAVCTNDFVFPYAPQQTASAASSLQRPIATALPSSPPALKPAARPAPEAPIRRLATAAPPPASPKPAPAAKLADSVTGASGGAFEVVLGSYTIRDNAVAASAKVDKALAGEMAGHRKALIAATVKGQAYTVLTVSGFATPTDAADFCRSAKAIALACMVKKGGPG